jgi:metal-responsive CopG/Arc/MetJ family transcriptional regulator
MKMYGGVYVKLHAFQPGLHVNKIINLVIYLKNALFYKLCQECETMRKKLIILTKVMHVKLHNCLLTHLLNGTMQST